MPDVTILLITSHKGPGRVKRARYKYIMSCAGAKVEGAGRLADTTGNRLAMTALIDALKRMRKPSMITVMTDSGYLLLGRQQLTAWEQNGWRRGNGSKVKNADLWKEIVRLQTGHATRYKFTEVDAFR